MLRRVPARTITALLVAVFVTPAALAVAPKKGRTYRGALAAPRNTIVVSFKVSASGSKVTGLRISTLPLYCSGGGPAVPISLKPTVITAKGTFKSTGTQTISSGPFKGQIGARLSITGTFIAGGKERGKLSVAYTKAPTCSGSSAYKTQA